jgi:hypothetical protein
MGGTHTAFEIADFPDHGRRMVRLGEDMQVYDLEDGRDFFELGPVE